MATTDSNGFFNTSPLSDDDLKELAKSYITREIAIEAGIRRVDHQTGAEMVGQKPTNGRNFAGLIFPYYSPVTGNIVEYRLRRDIPDLRRNDRGEIKSEAKYLGPPQRRPRVYFTPGSKQRINARTVAIVEGEKKALALSRYFQEQNQEVLVLGLAGVHSWSGVIGKVDSPTRDKKESVKGFLPDLEIHWKGRKVWIVFDANVSTNDYVKNARAKLSRSLRARGAKTSFLDIPDDLPGVNGVDDLLGLKGADFLTALFEEKKAERSVVVDRWPNTLGDPADLSMKGLAARFYERYEESTRYVERRGVFYNYEGGVWIESLGMSEIKTQAIIGEVEREQIEICMQLQELRAKCLAEPENPVLKEERAKLEVKADLITKFTPKIKTTYTTSQILGFARAHIEIPADGFDQNKTLFNVKNGTVDLATGELLDHDAADYCSLQSPVEFDQDATCPRWLQFLDEVFAAHREIIPFIQRAVGYSLSGDISAQVFFILYGSTGQNGKNAMFTALANLMGKKGLGRVQGYLATTSIETFLEKSHSSSSGHNEEIANLAGARLVATEEPEKSGKLAEGLIKSLTGEGMITASRKHEHSCTFLPTFKVWMATNHKPRITGTDGGIWRRPLLIPFKTKFIDRNGPKGKQLTDKDLKPGERFKESGLDAKLLAEMPGILNWAIEGYRLWAADGGMKDGLKIPNVVADAIQDYREESDKLGIFLSECLIERESAEAPLAKVYVDYRRWCEENGMSAPGKITFSSELKDRGIDVRLGGPRKKDMTVFGYGLLDDADPIPVKTQSQPKSTRGHRCPDCGAEMVDGKCSIPCKSLF